VVEFALVLPILMMFLFGIIEFGRGYNARIELTAAVREGVRTAALWSSCPVPAPVPTQTPEQCLNTAVTGTVRSSAPGLASSAIGVVVDRQCTAPVPNVKVNATYPFKYDIPFVGKKTTNLNATGVMRCGG
jgi:Flp pilus assembly protein TadG